MFRLYVYQRYKCGRLGLCDDPKFPHDEDSFLSFNFVLILALASLDLQVTGTPDGPDDDRNKLTYTYDGSVIKIRWATPLRVAEDRKVCISYRVLNPVTGLIFGPVDRETPTYVISDHETGTFKLLFGGYELCNGMDSLCPRALFVGAVK